MNALLRTLAFESLRYATMAWGTIVDTWNAFWDWYFSTPELEPTSRYFLGTELVFNDSYATVPEGAIYIEEWVQNGQKKCVVRYAGDVIPFVWTVSPHHQRSAKCPWIWVGDRNTEIDLTQTFSKFLVPGNRITMALVEKLIHVTDQTRLVYIENGSFAEKEFPGDGLLIKANGPV